MLGDTVNARAVRILLECILVFQDLFLPCEKNCIGLPKYMRSFFRIVRKFSLAHNVFEDITFPSVANVPSGRYVLFPKKRPSHFKALLKVVLYNIHFANITAFIWRK